MIIDVLTCKSDGTQKIEQQQVPDNWFTPPEAVPTEADDLMTMAVDHEYRITLLELGITE